MKFTVQLLSLFILAFLFSNNIEAQRRGGDPTEMAKKQTQMMTDSLTLSTAQAAKIGEINLKYAKHRLEFRKAARESEDFDRETMRENMRRLKEEQNAELQSILTKGQWANFERIEKAKRSRRETQKGSKRKRTKRNKKAEQG